MFRCRTMEVHFRLVVAVVFALLASVSWRTTNSEDVGKQSDPMPRAIIFESQIKALLESFRKNMTQPLDSMGLPTLDPFHLDVMPVNLDLNGARATGELEDLNVVGLSKFVVDRAGLDMSSGIHLSFRFFLEQLTATTKLNVTVADKLHLAGDNTITLTGDDLTLSGSIGVKSRFQTDNTIYLVDVTLDFSYGSLVVDLGDFSEDARLTTAVQSVVNDLLPQLLDREKTKLLNWAEKKVTDLGDKLLRNTTLNDILGLLG